MKKWEKVILIIAVLLLAGGGVIAIMAYQLGADTYEALNHGSFSFNIGNSRDSNKDKDNDKVHYETKDIDEDLTAFKNITIESETLKINIIPGDTYKIVGRNLAKVEYRVEGDHFVLKQKNLLKNLWNLNINFSRDKRYDGEVDLYIPEQVHLDQIKVDAGVGEITLQEQSANRIDVKAGVGAVNMSNTTAKKCILEGGVGTIETENISTQYLEITSGVGEIDFQGKVEGDIKIEGGVGSTVLQLKGNKEDYNYEINQGLGSVNINGDQYEGISNVKQNNDAPYTIEAEGGIGEIDINIE